MISNQARKPHLLPKYETQGIRGYKTTQTIYYKWRDNSGTPRRLIIPPDLIIKIPLILRLMFWYPYKGVHAQYLIALALHTYIYQLGGRLRSNFQWRRGTSRCRSWALTPIDWSRKEADQLLYIVLEESSIDALPRILLYFSARLFGWMKWKR